MIYQIILSLDIKDIKDSSDIEFQLEDRIGLISFSLNQQGYNG